MSYEQKIKNMSLEKICHSGQCFRMWKNETKNPGDVETGGISEENARIELPGPIPEENQGTYTLIAGNRWLEICQTGETFRFSCSRKEFETFWSGYFDLETDYDAVIRQIDPSDSYLREAAEFGYGIRILRQDLWEMIITFIISQQNNIRRIRKCIETICEKYGKRCTAPDGSCYYAFPTPEELSHASEEKLRACNLGYRSRYLVQTTRMIMEGAISLEQLPALPLPEARQQLLKLCGVGEKVADCIRLFALHDLTAFPIDTHIRQVLNTHYPNGFPFENYLATAGILQQYIFYYDLMKGKNEKNPPNY